MTKTLNRRERRAREHQDKENLKFLKKQAKNPPSDAASGIKLGDQLATAREWLDAINCYRAALEQNENNAPLLAKIAYACASGGFTNEAIQSYQAALAIEPENPELLRNMGAMCNAIGYPDRALEYLEQAITQQPKDPDNHYLLAETFRLQKEKEKSAIQYVLAIPLYREREMDPPTLIKIGRALGYLLRYDSAINFLREATSLAPAMPGAHFELANVYLENEDLSNAAGSYRRTLELAPRHSGALRAYAKLMAKRGQLDNTAWAYRRLQQLFPDDASIRHMLAASSQQNVHGVTDETYVKDIFDHYADGFEAHLVNELSYNTPEELRKMLDHNRKSQQLTIMDLGCGTGLCGPLFKGLARELVGVDLSKGMLAEAEAKNVYDKLILSELVSALELECQSQDLLIAADVLIYVGDLNPVFLAGQRALRAGGQFAFSVEIMDGDTFKLHISGRYRHSETYIQETADKNHFEIIRQQTSVLRMEGRMPVHGMLYILEKIDTDRNL